MKTPITIITSLIFFILFSFSCEDEIIYDPATLSTLEITEITENSALSGGTIIYDGGSEITAKGVVWSSEQNPTIDNNDGITNDGTGNNKFTSSITGLSGSTTYYVRAYATNSAGTGYGDTEEFTTDAVSEYTLSISSKPSGWGSTIGAGSYTPGTKVDIAASPIGNYKFFRWTGDSEYLDNTYNAMTKFTMPEKNANLTANFAECPIYKEQWEGPAYVHRINADGTWENEYENSRIEILPSNDLPPAWYWDSINIPPSEYENYYLVGLHLYGFFLEEDYDPNLVRGPESNLKIWLNPENCEVYIPNQGIGVEVNLGALLGAADDWHQIFAEDAHNIFLSSQYGYLYFVIALVIGDSTGYWFNWNIFTVIPEFFLDDKKEATRKSQIPTKDVIQKR